MESGEFKLLSNFQPLGNNQYRIFVTTSNAICSIVVPCNGHPSHEAIIDFFNNNYKKFDIEVINFSTVIRKVVDNLGTGEQLNAVIKAVKLCNKFLYSSEIETFHSNQDEVSFRS